MKLTLLIILASLYTVVALAVDQSTCPHPGVSGVSVNRNTVIGGTLGFDATLTFASAIPQGCQHFYNTTASNPQAVGICSICNFIGDGTNQIKTLLDSRVVDSQQNVTVTWQAKSGQFGPLVGNTTSTTVTITPIQIQSFTIGKTTLNEGESTTGTVTLENVVHNLGGSLRVSISASEANVVSIPTSITIQCCQTDSGHLHSIGTFTITGKRVFPNKQVVISVQRPNQTPLTRNITVNTTILRRP